MNEWQLAKCLILIIFNITQKVFRKNLMNQHIKKKTAVTQFFFFTKLTIRKKLIIFGVIEIPRDSRKFRGRHTAVFGTVYLFLRNN